MSEDPEDLRRARLKKLFDEVPEKVKWAIAEWWMESDLTAGQAMERLGSLFEFSVSVMDGRSNFTARDMAAGKLPEGAPYPPILPFKPPTKKED